MELWQSITDPFAYQFFQKGMAAAVMAGALCGLIGVYVTLRGMSYIGHGLSHAIFGGYAAAPLLGLPIVLGAGLWGLASALAINAVTRSRRIGADAAIGVVTTASFALGVALLTRFGNPGPAFDSLLCGSINGVQAATWRCSRAPSPSPPPSSPCCTGSSCSPRSTPRSPTCPACRSPVPTPC